MTLIELNDMTTRKMVLLKQSCVMRGIERRLEVGGHTGICQRRSYDLLNLSLMNVNARPELHEGVVCTCMCEFVNEYACAFQRIRANCTN